MQIKPTPLRAIPSGSQKLRPSLGPGLVWTASTPTVIRSRRAAFVGTATNPIYGVGAGGKSATWTDGSSALTGLVVPAQLLPAVNGLTFVLWAKPVSEAQMRFAFSQKVAGPFVPQISLGVNAGDSFTSQAGSLDLWIRDTSANTMNVRATGQIDGGLHCWVVRSNRSGGAIWRDGVAQTLATNNALTGGVYFDSTAVTCIGNLYNSDFLTRFSYPLFLVAGFTSALPDDECIRISRNPLSIFQPVRTWVPVSAAAGGAFKPAWAHRSNVVISSGVSR